MRIHFKQAVHIDGKDYALGTHDVPESLLKNNKYFHKLMEAGLVLDAEAMGIVSHETLADRQKKLAEKLSASPVSGVAPTPVVEQQPVADEGEGASPAPASSSDDHFEQSEEASTETPAKHEKHQHKKKHGK